MWKISLDFNGASSTSATRVTLDPLGRTQITQRKQSPGSSTYDSVESGYDALGRPERVTVPYPAAEGVVASDTTKATTTAYDALNRPVAVTDGGGGTTGYTYAQNDVLVAIGPAPNGENPKRRRLEYDALGRLTSVCEITSGLGSGTCGQNATQDTGFWTKYTYDLLDNVLTVTQNAQSNPQTRTFAYDGLGRLTSEQNPETGDVAYRYYYDSDETCGTSNGDLVRRVDPAGNATCYAYDSLHRVTAVTYPSGPYASVTPGKHFVYDSATVNDHAMANAKGRLAEAYTGASTSKTTDLGFSYSARGEVTDVWQNSPNSGGYYQVTNTYWANGLVNTINPHRTDLPAWTYTPDGEGRVLSVSASSGQNPVTSTTYNEFGLATGVSFGSGASGSFGYDPDTGRMTSYSTTYTSAGPPAAPGGLGATAGDGQVILSWSPSSGATSYKVYRRTAAGQEGATPVATPTAPNYTDTGLTNGTTYYYKVAAVSAGGTGPQSAEASATPLSGLPPAPTGLQATAGDGQVALSWTAASGATSYKVYRGTAAGQEGATAVGTPGGTSYTDTAVTNGTTYYYRVAAVNGSGTGPQSGEASAMPSGPPAAPTFLSASVGDGQVTLSWNPASGATSYKVYCGTAPGQEGATPIGTPGGTSYTDSGRTNGTTYYYKVAAVNASGVGPQSGEASATPSGPPPAPTGLQATGGNGQVTLNWTAASGATSYRVYRGTASGQEGATPIGTPGGTSYTDSGRTNGTTYYYKLAAVNASGTGPQSGEAPATPSGSPPAPTGLQATGGNGQVILNWSAASGATSYKVYRGTASGQEGATPIGTPGGTSYTDTGLTNGTAYYYKVAAVNASGTGPQSAEASATPSSGPTPAPTGLTARAGNGQVTLSWNASPGAGTYLIYRGNYSGGEGLFYSWPLTTYTDTGLTNGTTYHYKVAASSVNGTSPQSGEASATPSAPPVDLSLSNTTLSSGMSSYEASNSITAQTGFTINGTAVVTFRAGNYISLKPGFSASALSASPGTTTFHAVIGQ